jgi:hypothetical protein
MALRLVVVTVGGGGVAFLFALKFVAFKSPKQPMPCVAASSEHDFEVRFSKVGYMYNWEREKLFRKGW